MDGEMTAATAKRPGTDAAEIRQSSKKRKVKLLQPEDNRPSQAGELHDGAATHACNDNAAPSTSAVAAAKHTQHTGTAERISEKSQRGIDALLRHLQQARRGAAEKKDDRSEGGPISKYRGVVWCKKSNSWKARWGAQGKVSLGLFSTEEAAAAAVRKAQLELQGYADDISKQAELAASGAGKPLLTAANKSRYRGVSWHAHNNCWVANIKINGKQLWLGSHKTEEEAAMAVAEARKDPSRNKTRQDVEVAPRKYRGVQQPSPSHRWVAKIKDRYLGSFATQLEAAQAYDAAAIKEYGDKALLNFPASGERQAKPVFLDKKASIAALLTDEDGVNDANMSNVAAPVAAQPRKGVTAAATASTAATSSSRPPVSADQPAFASSHTLLDHQPSAAPLSLADQPSASMPIRADRQVSASAAVSSDHGLSASISMQADHQPLALTPVTSDHQASASMPMSMALPCALSDAVSSPPLPHGPGPQADGAPTWLREEGRLAADEPTASQHRTTPIDAAPSNSDWPVHADVCAQVTQLLSDYFARSDVTWQHCVTLLCCVQEMVQHGWTHQTVPRFVAAAPQNAGAEAGAMAANAASDDAGAQEREAKLQRKLQRMRSKYQAACALLQQHGIDKRELHSTQAHALTHNAVLTQQPPCQHHTAQQSAQHADERVFGNEQRQQTTATTDASAVPTVVAAAAARDSIAGCCAAQRSDACAHCAHLTAQVTDLSLLIRQQTEAMAQLQGELQAAQRTAEQQSLGWQSEQEQWQRSQQEWQNKQQEWQSSQHKWQSKQEKRQSNEDELRASNAAMQAECELLKQQLAEKQGAIDQLQHTLGALTKALEGSWIVQRDAGHAQHSTEPTQCDAPQAVQHDTQHNGQQQQDGRAVDVPEVDHLLQTTTQELEAKLAQAEARCAKLTAKLQSKTKRLQTLERRQKTAIADLERLAALPDDGSIDA